MSSASSALDLAIINISCLWLAPCVAMVVQLVRTEDKRPLAYDRHLYEFCLDGVSHKACDDHGPLI